MSPKTTLKSITLSAFRGASTTFKLDFEKDKSLTLIYGENGTGKTTICDAFEFLAAEKIGSLEDRGMGKGLERFWPTAGKEPNDLSVHLETTQGSCTAALFDKKIIISPPSAKPRIELLRRHQILRLIEAQPAARYNEIKRFIDISAFERSENSLRQLGKILSDEKDRAHSLEEENLQNLQNFFEAEGEPAGLNPVSWAKQKLSASAKNLDADIAAIQMLRSNFVSLEALQDRTVNALTILESAQDRLKTAEAAVNAALTSVSEDADELLKLLEAGHSYLHAHPTAEECPLCKSTSNIDGLKEEIELRLSHLSTLKKAVTERQNCFNALNRAKATQEQISTDYTVARQGFLDTIDRNVWRPQCRLPKNLPPPCIGDLGHWLTEALPIANSWPKLEAIWHGEKKFTVTLQSALGQYELNFAKRIELEALGPKVEEALGLCVAERQAFTDGIMKDIAQEVGRLYEAVHPGEGLDKISLPLDPVRRASLELKATFSGQDVPPQAYFSQSHLDTLGLCVFLALALRDRPSETILILDDVLGSVDEPHVERVISMIYEVSANFRHTIVTTHYRPWREKFRWGVLKPQQVCQFVELRQWTLNNGMMLAGSAPEIARLKTLLADPNPDIQAISSKAGVILEALLDFLTLKYACAVPRRAGGLYTLGELLPSVNGKLLAALKVEARDPKGGAPTATTELKPIIEQISDIAQTRNVMGAHFNTLSFDLYPQDGFKFAKLVAELADALICSDYGWPTKDKSGSYWNNGGDTRRLHPLKKPS
jgi:recombinational DNA repair ATPase RecF